MVCRLLIIIGVLLASLSGEAKLVVPDSLLTVPKVYTYSLASPDTAHAIIETMRERKMLPEWKLDMVEGNLNYDMRRFQKAVDFFERIRDNAIVYDSAKVELRLLRHLMYSYDALLEQDELTISMLRLRKRARECKNKAYEAMSLFMGGKWRHYTGQKESGYSQCQEAVELMVSSDYVGKHVELNIFYGELARMLSKDGRFDEAIRMSQLQETEARQPIPDDFFPQDGRYLRRVYGVRASLMAKAGRMADADKAYAEWRKATGGNAIDDMDVYDYLRLSDKDSVALTIVSRYHDFIHEQGDTLSYRMLSACEKKEQLLIDMGEYEQAMKFGRMVSDIADSLHIHRTYDVMSATTELFNEQQVSHRKTLWLSLLTACVLAFVVVGLVILYYVRAIRRRNMIFLRLFNRLDAYRQAVINGNAPTSPEVLEALNEVISLEEEVSADSSEQTEEPDDEDRRLFVEMDTQVTRDRLFLKPGLGREDLMRLIGVDKNRFGKMMSKYSDATNTSVYINAKRVEYGAMLLLEHPEYTVASVAAECGMSTPVTFNRIFKETYNMTPSEYREKMGAILQAGSHQKA